MTLTKMLPISRIKQETENIKTFIFNHKLESKPGQFVMVWMPGVGEKPMSISSDTGNEFSITVCAVGPFSKSLQKLKPGEVVGIKGPLGTHFHIKGNNIALVGGGYGAGPMAYIAEKASKQGFKQENIHYCLGARNEKLLLFEKRTQAIATHHIATDDGSKGTKGLVTDVLKEAINQHNIDMIYYCGPELMEKAIFDIAVEKNIDCEISIERYMKCGIGICGSCCVDPTGWRMCVEGPVLNKEQTSKIEEFGKYHRDATGRKVEF